MHVAPICDALYNFRDFFATLKIESACHVVDGNRVEWVGPPLGLKNRFRE
jgi:hypothetical protein